MKTSKAVVVAGCLVEMDSEHVAPKGVASRILPVAVGGGRYFEYHDEYNCHDSNFSNTAELSWPRIRFRSRSVK
jgi:hypothetical protein